MGYLDGFGVTLRKWVGVNSDTGRRVTTEYPEEVRPKSERFHGRHVLNRYEDGMEKCIGCELCAGVCPARCIYVRGQDNDPDDPTSPGERFGYVYEINYLRCIHCDLCVEACPTQAITETKMFEFAFTNRADGIYTKDELLVDDAGQPRRLPFENWDGGFDAAQDTSGWMRATSPSGDANFVGIVAWAGELGYGVRPPQRIDQQDDVVDDGHGHDGHGHDDHGHDDHGHDDHGHDGAAHDTHAPRADASAGAVEEMSHQAGQFDYEGTAQPMVMAPPDEASHVEAPHLDAPHLDEMTAVDPAPMTEDVLERPDQPVGSEPPTRAPGTFDAADADEPPAGSSSTRGRGRRRGRGDRR